MAEVASYETGRKMGAYQRLKQATASQENRSRITLFVSLFVTIIGFLFVLFGLAIRFGFFGFAVSEDPLELSKQNWLTGFLCVIVILSAIVTILAWWTWNAAPARK